MKTRLLSMLLSLCMALTMCIFHNGKALAGQLVKKR